MNYAIIGAGNVGQALARAFARKGIEVAIDSRRSALRAYLDLHKRPAL